MASPQPDNLSRFDSNFIDAVLYLMVNDLKFLREYGAGLEPDYFPDETRHRLADYARQFYQKNNCAAKNLFSTFIREQSVKERLGEARTKLLLLTASRLNQPDNGNGLSISYITSRLDEFLEFARLRNIRFELDSAIDAEDIDRAKEILTKSMASSRAKSDRPIDYFSTIQQRVNRREIVSNQTGGVHFMIPTLERKGIFAHRGEVSLCIAPSKRGKSIFLTHVGKCSLFEKFNVLHVSLENPIHMVEDRYDAMLSGIPTVQLQDLCEKLRTKIDTVSKMAKGRLHILWRFARTYSPFDLRADIQQLRAEGVRIDVVIVDYAEMMKPIGKYSGESQGRLARDDIFLHLRGVATEEDVVIVTAQQTPLKKRTKTRLKMEDGQESSMPAQHSSLILTLNQTDDEQRANEMRIYVDGYWHGQSGPQVGDILVQQDFSRMQFCLKEIPLSQGMLARMTATAQATAKP